MKGVTRQGCLELISIEIRDASRCEAVLSANGGRWWVLTGLALKGVGKMGDIVPRLTIS